MTARSNVSTVLFVCAVCLLGGCQSLSSGSAGGAERRAAVTVADGEADVADCEQVAEVAVRLPFPLLARSYPELTSLGQDEVARALRSQARRVGGDTVVPAGIYDGRTHGTVYDCGGAG
jgi:hypothetical protein